VVRSLLHTCSLVYELDLLLALVPSGEWLDEGRAVGTKVGEIRRRKERVSGKMYWQKSLPPPKVSGRERHGDVRRDETTAPSKDNRRSLWSSFHRLRESGRRTSLSSFVIPLSPSLLVLDRVISSAQKPKSDQGRVYPCFGTFWTERRQTQHQDNRATG